MVDVASFLNWVREKPPGRRSVKITIGESDPHYQPKIFVYDYDLMAGQFVKSVDEINLTAELEADLLHVFRKATKGLPPDRLQAVLASCGLDCCPRSGY